MLDPADPVGNLGEVADPELLLLLEAKGTVIGADDREIAGAQIAPQFVLVSLDGGTQWGGTDPLRTLEPGLGEVLLQRQIEVLRARLAEDVPALAAGSRQRLDRLLRRHVHYVERGTGDVRQHDRAVSCLLLGLPRPGERVVARCRVAASERLRDQHVDRGAVLGVHHDRGSVAGGCLHRTQDLAVIAEEHAGVGHEQLEAGDALVDELVHRLERLVVDAADDLMEPVVDRTVSARLVVPCREPVLHPFTGALHREVDDRGGATVRCSHGAGGEGVGGERATEGQLHVRVHVDTAGHDVLPGRVDHAISSRCEVRTQ